MKIKQFTKKHKIISLIIIIVLILITYLMLRVIFKQEVKAQYITRAVEKGTLITSVSGTGQVSSKNQIELKSQVSGNILSINVRNNQTVKTGILIVQLDDKEAQKNIRDAKTNLESINIDLQKLTQPADELDILQAENSLLQAKESKEKTEYNLEKAYADGLNTISDTFLDLPPIMTGLHEMLYGTNLSGTNQWNLNYYADAIKYYTDQALSFRDTADENYGTARVAYNKSFDNYKVTTRYATSSTIENLLDEAYETTKLISQSIKSANNLIDLHEDTLTQKSIMIKSLVSTHQNSLSSYTNTTNNHLLSLLSMQSAIRNAKEDLLNAERSIIEKTKSLENLTKGASLLDIKSKELSVKQKENTLLDAEEKLKDYYIRSPFDGVIANLSVQKGESISSGNVISSIITEQKTAQVTLNEIEAALIKEGQKAILEFDALDELSITGEVIEIDTIGTVSQGVVSYDVKILFDMQDERIKAGMSVSASIVIESKQNVLLIPSVALKNRGSMNYVNILINDKIETKQVVVGSTNDIMVEIIKGLENGDMVITQTISKENTNTITGGFGAPNDNTKNMMRIMR